jgi:hypothetical protein
METTHSSAERFTIVKTDNFSCAVTTRAGMFGAKVAIMSVKADGEVNKSPPIATASLVRRLTSRQLNEVHEEICKKLSSGGRSEGGNLECAIFWAFNDAQFNSRVLSNFAMDHKTISKIESERRMKIVSTQAKPDHASLI